MKKSSRLLILASVAMMANSLSAPIVYASEPDKSDTAQASPSNNETEVQNVKKTLKLKFIDAKGEEVEIDDPEQKYIKDQSQEDDFVDIEQHGFTKAEFDLSGIDGTVAIDEDKLLEGYQAEINPETKVLTVILPELTKEEELTLIVSPKTEEAEEVKAEENVKDAADEIVQAPENTASEIQANNEATSRKTVTINFTYSDSNKEVAQPCIVQLQKGTSISGNWRLPSPKGYELDPNFANNLPNGITIQIENSILKYTIDNIQVDAIIDLKFVPAYVEYKVNYWYENVNDDNYTLHSTETKHDKKTGELVASDLNPDNVTGFYPLNYDKTEKVAADGTTIVDIRYNRHYYLLTFDLSGGHGVEPIYARYGSRISVDTPSRAGYSFVSWDKDIPETMPAENLKFTAEWNPEKVSYTVAYWYENANDDGYSYVAQNTISNIDAGSVKTSYDHRKDSFNGVDTTHFTYNSAKNESITINGDGTSVLNVYFSRNVYTLDFQVKKRVSNGKYGTTTQWVSVKTVERKYLADTSDLFPVIGTDNTEYDGYGWALEKLSYANYTGGFYSMPGENRTYYGFDRGSNKKKIIYYVESLPGTPSVIDKTYNGEKKYFKVKIEYSISASNLSYDEDFQEIEGFSRWTSNPPFTSSNPTPALKPVNEFYYSRNRYSLEYQNGNKVTNTTSKYYEETLTEADNIIPSNPPEGYDPSAWEFEGWYTTADCIPGTKIDFGTTTMPASNMIVFAHWVPKTHKVTFHTDATLEEQHHHIPAISHGAFIEEEVKNPSKEGREFIGWFYKDGDTEKAFDIQNSPVNRDLTLYAKYKSDTIVPYTVKYVFVDNDGQRTEIAAQSSGSGLIDVTKTLPAKTGNDLYEQYREGYFPVLRSSSITLGAGNNELILYYVQAEKVPYTVKYLEKGTGKVLKTEKNEMTRNAVITEYAPNIPGYLADEYSKRLVLTYSEDGTAENVLIFEYTKDEQHALVTELHYRDDSNDPFISKSEHGEIGKKYTYNPMETADYKLEYVLVKQGDQSERIEGEDWNSNEYPLTEDGLVFEFHYAGYYHIVLKHDSTAVIDRLTRGDTDGYDLTQLVPETYLYGGLYDSSFTKPVTDEMGKNIKPSTGKTYYVKTVDRKYLWPALYAVFNLNSNIVDRIDAFTAADDDNYRCVGYGQEHSYAADHTDLYEGVEIIHRAYQKDENGDLILDENNRPIYNETMEFLHPNNFFKSVESGFLAGERIKGKDDLNLEGITQFTLRPYFVTPDGVKVDSRLARTFTIEDGKYDSIKFTNQTFMGNGAGISNPVDVQTAFVAKAPKARYSILNGDGIEAEEPEVSNEVAITVSINGTESVINAEKGNVTESITAPLIEGKYFAGWYLDEEFAEPANLTDVTADTKIYGKYINSDTISSELKLVSSFSRNTRVKAVIETGTDLPFDLEAVLNVDGTEYPISLTKEKTKKGNFLELLFGGGTVIWQHSGETDLGVLTGTKNAELSVHWITPDGTKVNGPISSYKISKTRIK